MSIEYVDYTSYTDNDDVNSVEEVVDVETNVEDTSVTMMGVVANATRVYLRQSPDKSSSYVTIMDEGDEVMIDATDSDDLGNVWYHLTTVSGAEGYAMSDFIEITEG